MIEVAEKTMIDELVDRWKLAKRVEAEAAMKRVEIERQLVAAFGGAPEEGSKTHTAPGGAKVTLQQNISRTVDVERWLEIRPKLGPEGQAVIDEVVQYKVDKRGLEWLRENKPGYYHLACQAITEKPMKIGVRIKDTEE